MKQYTHSLFAVIFVFASCNQHRQTNETTTGNNNAAYATSQEQQLNYLLEKMDVPSQFFTVPCDKPSSVTGKNGTVIYIAPVNLETEDGGKPVQDIIVELKELRDQEDLIRANAQTKSNGKLLVSGGAYYLNMVSGGKQLHIKKDKALKAAFPKISDNPMQLFYGKRDSNTHMDWEPAQKLTTNNSEKSSPRSDTSVMIFNSRSHEVMGYVGTDSTYKRDTAKLSELKRKYKLQKHIEDSIKIADLETTEREMMKRHLADKKISNAMYDITEIKKLGWINLDRFEGDGRTTTITFSLSPTDSISCARVYLVFKSMNSMFNTTWHASSGQYTQSFGNVPIGREARVIAVAYKKDQLHAFNIDMTTAEYQNTVIIWKPTNEAELNRFFRINE